MFATLDYNKAGKSLVLPDSTVVYHDKAVWLKNLEKLQKNKDFNRLVKNGWIKLSKTDLFDIPKFKPAPAPAPVKVEDFFSKPVKPEIVKEEVIDVPELDEVVEEPEEDSPEEEDSSEEKSTTSKRKVKRMKKYGN